MALQRKKFDHYWDSHYFNLCPSRLLARYVDNQKQPAQSYQSDLFHSSTVFTIKAFALPSLAEVSKITHYGTASLAAGACADIATAFALCYFSTDYAQGRDTLVNNLVRYAISTGAITSVVSIACLILFNLMPDNFVFISVYFVLSKCYAVSFMATLNTRRLVNGRGTDHSRQSDRPEQLPSSRPTRNFYISASDPRSQHRRGDSEAQIWTGSETKESANQSRHERFSLEVINPPPLYSSQSLSQMSFNSHGSGPRAI
ncbi:hypothetical protein VNI00_015327 [Paramarasmius palmivorus]|uniref:DUF6534 domain-containing protein n=1 Tax=Paramarasmius palmivorus TaxID=297713 RepID=A0AAW0BLM0_9AGAR